MIFIPRQANRLAPSNKSSSPLGGSWKGVLPMPHDQAYLQADKKIEQARKSGMTEFDLNVEWNEPDNIRLTELPESLGTLIWLQSLNLSGNRLTSLPESLGNLTQLQSLNLYVNRLTALPESLGNLTQLQSLNLSGNRLTSLPESLGNLTQLQSLESPETC